MMQAYANAFKKYFDFEGKATIREYWMAVLGNFVISLALACLTSGMHMCDKIAGTIFTTISSVYEIAVFIPFLALGVRRLHDTGRSGFWLFLSFIPLAGAIVLIIFFCEESNYVQNRAFTMENIEKQDPNNLSDKQIKSQVNELNNIDAKIAKLKELRDKNEITQEEYREHLNKLIDKL